MASKARRTAGRQASAASRPRNQTVPAARYSLNCFDPRYPLGYPLKASDDFVALQELCDAENAECVQQGTFVQFWIVANGRYVYPPEFSAEPQQTGHDRDDKGICPEGAA